MKLRALMPLLTYPDAHSLSGVSCGIAAAKILGANLHAIAFAVDIPPIVNPLSGMLINLPELASKAEKQSANSGENLLVGVQAEAAKARIDTTTAVERTRIELVGETAAYHSRYYDLSIVPWKSSNPGIGDLAEALIFGSGRPTMVIPEHAAPTGFDRVSIAWDGTRNAARAVSDARALLDNATEVSIFTVADDKPIDYAGAGQRLADCLRSAGVRAVFNEVNRWDATVSETLQHHAKSDGAGLLVMGAYGHSRFREFVLGGATMGVLTELQMPVLFSH